MTFNFINLSPSSVVAATPAVDPRHLVAQNWWPPLARQLRSQEFTFLRNRLFRHYASPK